MRGRALNSQTVLEIICCALFGGLLFYLAVSGEYLAYVTPRMGPYLYFTAAVMLLWAIMGVKRLFRPQHRVRAAHCFVLVIPLLFLLLPHTPVSASNLSTNYSDMTSLTQTADNASNSASGSADTTDSTAAPSDTPTENDSGLSGLDKGSRKITVSDEEFYPWLSEIFGNMNKYEGYTISLTGYVLKDTTYLGENEFIPARLAMTCCTADLVPVGFICRYDGLAELAADSWVTVEGVIVIGQYKDQDEPQIDVTGITPADEVEGYIFPYS